MRAPRASIPLLRQASRGRCAVMHAVTTGVFDGPRAQLRSLFALAEDSPDQLASYLEIGRALVARIDDEIVGHVLLVTTDDPSTIEIKNMAVSNSRQRLGVGTELIAAARRDSLARRVRRLVVATAAADLDNLRFYQRNAFRFTHVERDAFVPATGYPTVIDIDGIPLRDRVWLDLDLDTEDQS
ncbi:MAG: GNAT family N-acetyltransferase [Pseudolysinimonas sp.]